MQKAYLTISNPRGFLARVAARFVNLVSQFDVEFTVSKIGQTVFGLSIMGLMMLADLSGKIIELETISSQTNETLDALSDLIEQKVGDIL